MARVKEPAGSVESCSFGYTTRCTRLAIASAGGVILITGEADFSMGRQPSSALWVEMAPSRTMKIESYTFDSHGMLGSKSESGTILGALFAMISAKRAHRWVTTTDAQET